MLSLKAFQCENVDRKFVLKVIIAEIQYKLGVLF